MSFAATLKHRIRIEARPVGTDENGDAIKDWTEVCTVWADIRLPRGIEVVRAGAVSSVVSASIRIRKRSGIDSSMRVVHGADIYNIKAVLPDLRQNIHIDLVCEIAK